MNEKLTNSNNLLIRPIRFGVFFDTQRLTGGGCQQGINAALLVNRLPRDLVDPVFYVSTKQDKETLNKLGIQGIYLKIGFWQRIEVSLGTRLLKFSQHLFNYYGRIFPYHPFERKIIANRIDLMYFLRPSPMSKNLQITNFITTVWDLCHRDELEFPEVRKNRNFENREQNGIQVLPKAVAVFVDSEMGRLNLIRRYNIDKERIYVIPFSPAVGVQATRTRDTYENIDIRKKYSLDVPYVYYPAQFWSHKNHVYLLEGLSLLESEYGIMVGAIFSGKDQGNLSYVKKVVDKLGLTNRIRFVGYVTDDEVPLIYRQSIALVMPTYFGPTNLPPLEAFNLGVPVLYPDKVGLRDQVQDAALLMDLNDPLTMANHLKELISNPNLREKMIKKGKERSKQFSDKERMNIMIGIVKQFQRKRLCWS